jgi:hypothetical protein
MPDAKTMGRWGVAVGPEVVKQIHDRMVQIARNQRVAEGRRMRVDTTVVETNIHYPTDSSLLGYGLRVLTRTMKKIIGDRRRGGSQAARPQPERETAGAGDRAGSTQQALGQSGKADRGLPQIVGCDRPGAGPGQALRQGDPRRRQVARPHPCDRRYWRVCATSSKPWCPACSSQIVAQYVRKNKLNAFLGPLH